MLVFVSFILCWLSLLGAWRCNVSVVLLCVLCVQSVKPTAARAGDTLTVTARTIPSFLKKGLRCESKKERNTYVGNSETFSQRRCNSVWYTDSVDDNRLCT